MGLTTAYNAEAAVIGSILIQPELFAEASTQLCGEDFQLPLCRSAFEGMLELCCEGKPIDPLTVLAEVGDTPANREGLLTLAQGVPSTANFSSYVGIVVKQRQRRTAATTARQLAEALEPGFDIGDPLPIAECAAMAGQLLQAFEGREQREAMGIADLFADFDDRQTRPAEFFTTGIGSLDKRVHINGGHFIVVAGRPSSGKTAFTLQMALHMAARHNVVYYSLETSPPALFDRAVANYAGVPLENIKRRTLTTQERAQIGSDGNTIAWSYDQSGKMLGFTLNGVAYFYLRNQQGDIVAIHDAAGNVVATYEYDAWGKLLDIQDYSGYNLAVLNPIRYVSGKLSMHFAVRVVAW